MEDFMFISDNQELNIAISRYFKYIYNTKIATLNTLKLTNHCLPPSKIFVVQNEVLINDKVYGIFPPWFDWGIKNNKNVYCFTHSNSDSSSNIINWKDLFAPNAFNHFHSFINYKKVPHFDTTAGLLHGLMQPHSGDSLYDLATKLYTIFVNFPRKLKKTEITAPTLKRINTEFIDKGVRIFSQFQNIRKRYHLFLTYLPESRTLFSSISKLDKYSTELQRRYCNIKKIQDKFLKLLEHIKTEVIWIHEFFENLEPLLLGDRS